MNDGLAMCNRDGQQCKLPELWAVWDNKTEGNNAHRSKGRYDQLRDQEVLWSLSTLPPHLPDPTFHYPNYYGKN